VYPRAERLASVAGVRGRVLKSAEAAGEVMPDYRWWACLTTGCPECLALPLKVWEPLCDIDLKQSRDCDVTSTVIITGR
jgi:hypothetical protein